MVQRKKKGKWIADYRVLSQHSLVDHRRISRLEPLCALDQNKKGGMD